MRTSFIILLIFIPNMLLSQLDLTPPADSARVFLPRLISTAHHEHSSPTINLHRQVICWSIWERPKPEHPRQMLKYMAIHSDQPPQTLVFSEQYSDGGPVWMDEDRLLFYSKRPLDPAQPDKLTNDLWICKKNGSDWEKPYCLYFSQYTGYAFIPSVTHSGTIYFVGAANGVENNMGIYVSEPSDAGYQKPVLLPAPVNSDYFDWTPFIAADDSYLLFSSNRPGSKDAYGDLFICFRDAQGNWREPVPMGEKVNSERQERFPGVIKGLGILFFTRATEDHSDDIFWIDAKLIDELRINQK